MKIPFYIYSHIKQDTRWNFTTLIHRGYHYIIAEEDRRDWMKELDGYHTSEHGSYNKQATIGLYLIKLEECTVWI